MQSPSLLQVFERQTIAPLSVSHGPSPSAYPHSLSFVSHTRLMHVSLAASDVQLPSSVGLLCAGSLGTGWPFSSVGLHAWFCMLHHVNGPQSESMLQPASGMQVPSLLHAPERQTTPWFCFVQGPSSFRKPHLLSFVSQTELRQTSVAAGCVQVASSVGFACGGSLGIAVPFTSFGAQTWFEMLHQSPFAQSPSTLQPPAGWQRLFALHDCERQTTVWFAFAQGPSPFA